MTRVYGTDIIDQMAEAILRGDLDQRPADINDPEGRQVVLTWASEIEMRPTYWLWQSRMPLGELTLLAGREGIGKSTVAFQLAAWITRGTMKGEFIGHPKRVIIAATEDSWESTIVPRLKGAGADLSMVARCEVVTKAGTHGTLVLPKDVAALRAAIVTNDVKLLLLDPLMSRLSSKLDSYRDAEVRQALEPLTDLAKAAGCAVLGLIHVNKSAGTDPLNAIMGSRAFPAVARAVLVAMKDPLDETRCLLGLEKSNLGSTSAVPTYVYEVVAEKVAEFEGKDIITGVVHWLGDSAKSIRETMENAAIGEDGSSVDEAAAWLEDYLTDAARKNVSPVASADVRRAAGAAGINLSALQRARKRLDVHVTQSGFPRTSSWELGGRKEVPFK